MQHKLSYTFIVLSLLMVAVTKAQNVGINATGASPNPSAMLDIAATNKGVLITRVSLNSITDVATIPNPAVSLLVYNTNAGMTGGGVGFYYWNGMAWTKLNDGMATSGTTLWNANGSNISNGNPGNVGIGNDAPKTPLDVSGQDTINLPFSIYNGYLNHVSAQIVDTAAAINSIQKIGLYTTVKNHSNRNVGVLSDVTDTENHSNYGLWGNVSQNPGPTGESIGVLAYDQVNAPNTFASYTYGKAVYSGVEHSNVTGATLTNAGNGLMQWSKPVAFLAKGLFHSAILVGMPSAGYEYIYQLAPVFISSAYNLSNGYNTNNGIFTVPVSGIYHFDYTIGVYQPTQNNYGTIEIGLKVNDEYQYWTGRKMPFTNNNHAYTNSGSVDINLNAGDTVKVVLYNNSYLSVVLGDDYGPSVFSGHLIR